MADGPASDESQALRELRDWLLRERPPALGPDRDAEAFQRHKLLASSVHRATRLDRRSNEKETQAWVRYVTNHFPPGRNGQADAQLLFAEWRTPLLKDDSPGPPVAITHGQSTAHWQRDPDGRLCINLEDMWADFEQSVGDFIAYLNEAPDRREVALRRWRESKFEVRSFVLPESTSGVPVTGSPVVPGASVMAAPKRRLP